MHKVKYFTIIIFFTSMLLISVHTNNVVAEPIDIKLGIVNDLVIDGNAAYYFEQNDNKSHTFLPDTKIMKYDDKKIDMFSNELFMFPTELHIHDEYLYFVTLSDSCKGYVMCDFQDIIQISKNNFKKQVTVSSLKSAVHISTSNDAIYASESNGNIWNIRYIDGTKKLMFKSENIIMDLVSNKDTVYWIEEINDLNNRIRSISKENSTEVETIAQNLQIPYDLRIIDNVVFWNEIQIESAEGSIAEFTKVMKYDKNKVILLDKFKNTTPISVFQYTPHYGPYLSAGNYIFVVNNTKTDSTIHMKNFKSGMTFDIATLSDEKIKFLKAGDTSLYVIGINDEGFTLHHYTLPVSVPEFSSGIGIMMILSTVFIIFSLKVKSKITF